MLIAYAITLILGEMLRAQLFPKTSRKRMLFSGPFVLLKLKHNLSPQEFRKASTLAKAAFRSIIFIARTNVWTSVVHKTNDRIRYL